jgi:hypothetical protein
MQTSERTKKPKMNHMDFILRNCLPQKNLKYLRKKSQNQIQEANFSKAKPINEDKDSINKINLYTHRKQSI